jgi:hypothetical protein
VSDGAQHKLNVALETALVTETWAQRTASWRGHGASASDGVRGRNVPSGGGCLVAIELASNFILLEGYAADRSAATWTAVLEDACTGVAVEVMQSTADEAKALRRHAETDLGAHHSPDLFHGPETSAQVEQVAGACADVFQRSSSCVEGRNGQLSLHHHGRHRLSDRKLAALTAVHNFHICRADGTTAAERFFGRAHPALFERLLLRVPLPPRPRRRRTRPPKPAYLTPAAA